MLKLPIWPFILVAALQLAAFVYFTEQDSPWRLLGVGIAVVIMVFVCVIGFTRKTPKP